MTATVLLLAIQAVALVGIAAALLLAQRQHRTTQAQLEAIRAETALQRDAARAENILYALGLLRDPDFRKAVMIVRSRLQGRSIDSWEPGDNFHVLLVCSTYNFLGLLLKHEIVPPDLFLEHWGASVLDMYGALEEFIDRRRRANPGYCADFLWLAEQCQHATRSAPASRDDVPLHQTARDAADRGWGTRTN